MAGRKHTAEQVAGLPKLRLSSPAVSQVLRRIPLQPEGVSE